MKAAILMAALVAAGAGQAQQARPDAEPQVTVAGEGQVAAAPDLATVRLGVVAEAGAAAAATEALSADLGPVIDALVAEGVAPADIETGTLVLSPVYAEPAPDGRAPEIGSYRAESLVSVELRRTADLGRILATAVEAGANRIDGVSFALSDPDAVADAALADAMADAMRKAGVIAEAAGMGLGPVRSIAETGGGGPGPIMMEARAAMADVPIAPGRIETTARLSVTFDLVEAERHEE